MTDQDENVQETSNDSGDEFLTDDVIEEQPERPIMDFFAFRYLPPELKDISRPFANLAAFIHNALPVNAESSTALRKLLEAKDCAVRAALAKEQTEELKGNG